ncbi:MAG TPA: ethylbenzene dehydrogenase-related protein [Bacteroidota bacterium]|nr:ethylbenzene dehydrogenase-related protein [Bacteroidota bacterium]
MRMLAVVILCSVLCVDSMLGFQVYPPVASVENGKVLYGKYCSTCHGVDGKGEGTAALYLSPKPRDFTRGIFKFQSTPAGSLPTDQDLHRVLLNGMPGSGMPSWDRLSDQDRTDLVAYIKSFSPRFQSEKPADPISIGSEPARTPKMVADGKAVYALASCWSCHGKTGKGDGPASGALVDDQERPIRPYNFTRAGAFKGGGTPKDIYRTFSGGIGGTPMPGYGEDALSMGQEDFADLSNLEGQYTDAEIREVKSFVDQLPPRARIDAMSVADRKTLADGLRWSLVYYVLSLSDPTKTQVTYRTTDHPLTVNFVDALAAFMDPAADQWKNVKESELALISLWQRDTPTDRVYVKTTTDGKSVAFRLEWEDPTNNDGALYNGAFGDAAAIQFPLDPASDPFFAMGDSSLVVNIWQWKSWWERDLKQYAGVNSAFPRNAADFYMFDVAGGSHAEIFASKDSAKVLSMSWNAGWGSGNLISAQTRTSPVEDLNARGFHTLTSQSAQEQNVQGKGVWRNGRWSVVFTRELDPKQKGDVTLLVGTTLPVAFAVWDGAFSDRNGQKMVTNWYRLTIGSK